MSELTYESYNDKSFAVRGDRAIYDGLLKKIGARWHPRMKGGEGWLLNRSDEDALIELIEDQKKSQRLDEIAESARSRKGQKKYHRGESEDEGSDGSDGSDGSERSERSESEERPVVEAKSPSDLEPSESDESPVRKASPARKQRHTRSDSEDERKERKREKRRELEAEIARLEAKQAKKGSRHTDKRADDPMGYYKSYGKKPKDFRDLYASPHKSYSSSDESTESDDDFPSPGSPRKRYQDALPDDDMKSIVNRVNSMQKRLYEIEIKTKGMPLKKKGGR